MLQIAQSFLASSSDSSSEDDEFLDVIVPHLEKTSKQNNLNNEPPQKRPNNGFVNQYFTDIVQSSYILDEDFKLHFAISRSSFEELLRDISSPIVSAGRPPISTKDSLLITIWTLLNQEPYRVIAGRFNISIGHCVRVFHETCLKLLRTTKKYIKWPTGDMAQQTILDFMNCVGNEFPHVFGCMGSTHLIIPPSQNDLTYYDQTGNNSIILLAVCDSKGQFLNINVGWPGSASYSKVWTNSVLYDTLKNFPKISLLPKGSYLLGDVNYPLDEFLMVPFSDESANTKEKLFNCKLNVTRSIINNAFGQLKGTFARLRQLNIIKLVSVKSIATAACILHNLSLQDGVVSSCSELWQPYIDHSDPSSSSVVVKVEHVNESAYEIRNKLMNQIIPDS